MKTISRFWVLLRLLTRLEDHGAAFDERDLRRWLEKLVTEAVRKRAGSDQNPVTFEDLFAATGIELFVVAANVSRSEQVVFSHRTTPKCQVVDAVMASSGLPGAFASGKLMVEEHRKTSPRRLHTIVDGGIWANYPQFVFKDQSFREFVGLPPLDHRVIGFILEETTASVFDGQFGQIPIDEESGRVHYRTATFADPDEPRKYPRTEAILKGEEEQSTSSERTWKRIAAVALTSVFLISSGVGLMGPSLSATFRPPGVLYAIFSVAFVSGVLLWSIVPLAPEENNGLDHSWPRNRLTRFMRIALGYFHPLVVLLGLAPFIVTLAIAIAKDKGPGEISGWEEHAFRIVPTLYLALTAFVGGCVAVVFATGVVLLMLVRKTLADAGWGIVQTYGAGPGAPRWAGAAAGDWVVRVPVPKEISTLTFDVETVRANDPNGFMQRASGLEIVWQKAYEVTGARLDEILRSRD
ncbi:MAG: hypothetical protein A3H96_22400 [Acidobacteria bacterium RIFCSPLOWO2_02_FULL_67_36]|nr:MAG: hypothetical protein A3H96_22400 [Acidobacteria bacterium RIFCSPLOWO2_02_FULL_67_36]